MLLRGAPNGSGASRDFAGTLPQCPDGAGVTHMSLYFPAEAGRLRLSRWIAGKCGTSIARTTEDF